MSLLDLPREIRDRVYEFVFDFSYAQPVAFNEDPKFLFIIGDTPELTNGVTVEAHTLLSLLSASRQIHAESARIFYSKRLIATPDDLDRFLANLSPGRLSLIRKLAIRHMETVDYYQIEAAYYQIFHGIRLQGCINSLDIYWQSDCEFEQAKLIGAGIGRLTGKMGINVYEKFWVQDNNAAKFVARYDRVLHCSKGETQWTSTADCQNFPVFIEDESDHRREYERHLLHQGRVSETDSVRVPAESPGDGGNAYDFSWTTWTDATLLACLHDDAWKGPHTLGDIPEED